jgi:UDP-glucose 4-epimerase
MWSSNILASRGASGVYNIACARSISLNSLLKVIGKILGKEVRPRYESARIGDIKHSLADISRAKGMGYFPKYDLKEALLETIEWYRAIS